MAQNKRDPVFDIMRGLGITLMVAGHAGCPFSHWLYLFHMPLFFMISGWFFKPEHTGTRAGLFRILAGKVRTLWLPFVIANTAFTLCNNLFLRLHLLTEDERILEMPGNLVHSRVTLHDIVGRTFHWFVFDGGTQLGSPMWFIQVLFQISLLYALVNFVCKKFLSDAWVFRLQTLLAVLLLGIGWLCQRIQWSFWLLDVAFSCYPLYHLGVMLRRWSLLPRRPMVIALTGIAGAVALCCLQFQGEVVLSENRYTSPVFLVLCSVCGWYMVYAAARLLSARAKPFCRFFAFAGHHSLTVLILHYLCFKPVTWAGLHLTGGEPYLLAACPVLFTGGYWWIAYTVTGLLLPLGIRWGILRVQTRLQQLRQSRSSSFA